MRFVPSVTIDHAYPKRSWFIVHPKGLVVRRDGNAIALPTEDDARLLGLRAEDAYRMGSLDETDALVATVTDVGAPFEPLGIRSAAAFLDGGLFGVVGHALHTADWLTTSRFCGRCGSPTQRIPTERE